MTSMTENTLLDENAPIPAVIPIELADGYRVWYSTRLGGSSNPQFGHANMSPRQGDDDSAVASNRYALNNVLGSTVRTVHQIHSGEVVLVDEVDSDEELSELEADGMVTTRGATLGVFGADCLPVLLVDPESGITGACHCGRRGLMNDIIGQTVAAMEYKGADISRIKATLGPCICGECYEVGSEIAMEFDNKFPGSATITRFGGAGIDLEKAALQALALAGIRQENLVDSLPRVSGATRYLAVDEELSELCENDGEGQSVSERLSQMKNALCTLENPLWFSYRRATLNHKKESGRFLACVSSVAPEPIDKSLK